MSDNIEVTISLTPSRVERLRVKSPETYWDDLIELRNLVVAELPEPAHVWEVGEWLPYMHGVCIICRIADIAPDGSAIVHGRHDGVPISFHVGRDELREFATPCNPPYWWDPTTDSPMGV